MIKRNWSQSLTSAGVRYEFTLSGEAVTGMSVNVNPFPSQNKYDASQKNSIEIFIPDIHLRNARTAWGDCRMSGRLSPSRE